LLTRPVTDAALRRVAGSFNLLGDYAGAIPYGTGHINDTFAATLSQGGAPVRYILQRINAAVFRSPLAVMENVERITTHLRACVEASGLTQPSRRVLSLVRARDGRAYHIDDDGHVWRCYLFIEGARSWDVLRSPVQAFEGARAFGLFQRLAATYAGPRLHETIPRFHHTPSRVESLEAAVTADPARRAAGARPEIDLALSRRELALALLRPHEQGAIPERVTHNDTKLNNVLLDDATGEGMCVLDLDTVMPGLSLYDFGDMVRTATNPVAEDHPDPTAVRVAVPMFVALARGYLAGAGDALLPVERGLLVTAGRLLTYECGVRFLTDHLNGDTYFRVHRTGHNLDRARTQFALLRSLEEHGEELERIAAAATAGGEGVPGSPTGS
jgi:hypothetical protein